MDNHKDDRYYINKIIENANLIMDGMEKVSKDMFDRDSILQAAMMFYLIQISENAKRISEEMQEKYSYIPWSAIFGLRNRVVHDYGNVDLKIVYDTLHDDIPYLINELDKI
jgi:Uncharacterized conserved protein